MAESSFFFEEPPKEQVEMFASFMLENEDTITIHGNSIEHVLFEFHRKFPEGFPCKAIGFSGRDKEESSQNLKTFLSLLRRFKK